MGAELERMHRLNANPPITLENAKAIFNSLYNTALEDLTPLAGSQLQDYYIAQAEKHGTAPMAVLLGDVSTINLYAGQSGLLFQDKAILGACNLGKTILINGNSGLGKNIAIKKQRDRLCEFQALLRKAFMDWYRAKLAANDGDVEMTPFISLFRSDFDGVNSVNCGWIRSQYEEVKLFYILF